MSARSLTSATSAVLAGVAFTIGFAAPSPALLASAAQGTPVLVASAEQGPTAQTGAQAPAAPAGAQGGGRGGGRGGRGGPPVPTGPARQTAPVDLTGTWVSVVTEDWMVRMVTPQKLANGQADVGSIPVNQAARQAANQWDPAKEGACEAYGVGGLMRMPGRFKISWQDDNTLKIESDAGQQTRLLHFAAPGSAPLTAAGQQRTLQGYSVAEWQRSAPTIDAFLGGQNSPNARWGSLKAVTTNMLPGWLQRNGVPYSQNATITEYFTRFTNKDAGDWFVITTITEDPQFLTQPWITSTNFKKEPNDAKWSPAPCKASS